MGFHHVLTELAFLQIRKDHTKNHGIIPVVLSGDNVEYLEFVERCDVFLKGTNKEPYKLFFELLERVYADEKSHTTIRIIQNCCKELQKKDDISAEDISKQVIEGLHLLKEAAARGVRYWDHHNQGNTSGHFMVPFGRNENFVGRENILEQLLKRIPPAANKDNCQHTAIEGLGGIGKTQIALEAAYRVRDKHPSCSVFWVPAVNLTSFENAYREIGQLLNCQGINNDKADVKLLVKDALSQENTSSWLLIIDNADDVNMLFQDANPDDYLPFSWHGSILFTTRNNQITEQLDIPLDNIITVGQMNNAENAHLLQRGLRKSQIGDAKSTDRLLEYLAHLPLAIKQASAFMALNKNVTVSKYLEFCESSDAGMIELLGRKFHDRHRYKDYAENQNQVATTWLISFKQILQHNPQAANYLKFICILAEKDIPLSLLLAKSEIERAEAVGLLYAYAFILERNTPDSFDIHRLVRLVMRNWLQQNGEWEEWTAKVVRRLNEEYPFPDHTNIQTWTKYLPHGQEVLKIDGAIDIGDASLLINTAESYSFLGKYTEAEKLYRHTLKQTKSMPGGDYHSAMILNNLAVALDNQGRYEEAKKIYRQTLQLKEEVLGKKHPTTLLTMDNLALALNNQGKDEEAEKICRQTLDLRGEVLGKKHPETLTTMDNLALALNNQGKYEEAEKICRQTLDLRGEVLGRKHPDTLTTMSNLTMILTETSNKQGEAEELCRQALKLKKELLGIKHPSTLKSMSVLASNLIRQKKYEEAEKVCRQVLELGKEVLGMKHPDTFQCMYSLAYNLTSQKKYEEAEKVCRQALELREEVLGMKHPDTFQCMYELAYNLTSQKKYEEAEKVCRQTLELEKEVLGIKHSDTLATAELLACILQNRGKLQNSADGLQLA
ncbi:hypothetical protein F4860DRAFT_258746 [Xylaria cubensis]|nr:hypothetical protein F4860DRAFT_258746 [Xylaria cubensis]